MIETKDLSLATSLANGSPECRPAPYKLWLYTNYDCNIRCSYCVAESSPEAPRRALGLARVKRLVDEALDLDIDEIFFTGGEPFILDDIYDMLAYASARLPTTVLTNVMLSKGRHLDRLLTIANDNLKVQVSPDGARPEHHEPHRGSGTWAKTVEGIQRLLENDFHLVLSTTETADNVEYLDELADYRQMLGIPERDHIIRPVAKRGFAQEGIDVDVTTLAPEITVTVDGIYWHPLASPGSDDMLITREHFPLAAALDAIQVQLGGMDPSDQAKLHKCR
ncbi:MAG: radical SAM protein [Chloroflexi bacterium]|nr:radical SAM protein [Chloroflexota bacterium]